MRFLFVVPPAFGHWNVQVPIARRLKERGHEVVAATTDDFVPAVERVGVECRSVGPAGDPAAKGPVDVDRGAARTAEVLSFLHEETVAELYRVARSESPFDAVLHDHVGASGALIARLLDVPNVYLSVGTMRPPQMIEGFGKRLRPVWASYGHEMPDHLGLHDWLYVDRCPPSLQPPEIADVGTARAVQPLSYDGNDACAAPAWLHDIGQRPVVYVTLGTEFNAISTFIPILDGLAELDVDVIATIGGTGDIDDLGPLPGNVRVERYIPQSLLIPRCDLVVCHGGSGTLLESLTHGVPMVLAPQGADQGWNAPLCARRGVAYSFPVGDVEPTKISAAARTVLSEPSYRDKAEEVRAEISALPGLDETVDLVETVARTRTPAT